jgi:hypothetical protein
VICRSGVVAGRSTSTVSGVGTALRHHRSAAGSLPLLREDAAGEVRVRVPVRVEGRERHEQDKGHETRRGERQMVAEKAATQVAARAG